MQTRKCTPTQIFGESAQNLYFWPKKTTKRRHFLWFFAQINDILLMAFKAHSSVQHFLSENSACARVLTFRRSGAMQCSVVNAVQCSTVQCSAEKCSTVHCSIVWSGADLINVPYVTQVKKNLRQEERKFQQNWNCDKYWYFLNYILKCPFFIKYLINTLWIHFLTDKLLFAFISLNFYTKRATNKIIYNRTLYAWNNKFTPAKKFYTTAGCDGWDI